MVGCRTCAKVWPAETTRCTRCGTRLRSRESKSLSRVWAWWWAGVLLYIPANLYPMLLTEQLFSTYGATIIGGAVDLWNNGDFAVAAIILVASIGIPLAKFAAIAWLAISVQRGSSVAGKHRMHLYEVVEFIGRWSMIDVFVVAITSALVQLNLVASIKPGPAALAFALSVIFTMLSAQSFDSRMIWDTRVKKKERAGRFDGHTTRT